MAWMMSVGTPTSEAICDHAATASSTRAMTSSGCLMFILDWVLSFHSTVAALRPQMLMSASVTFRVLLL